MTEYTHTLRESRLTSMAQTVNLQGFREDLGELARQLSQVTENWSKPSRWRKMGWGRWGRGWRSHYRVGRVATGAEKTRGCCALGGHWGRWRQREDGTAWWSRPKITGNFKVKLTALFYIKCFVQEVEGKCHLFFSWTKILWTWWQLFTTQNTFLLLLPNTVLYFGKLKITKVELLDQWALIRIPEGSAP